MKILIIGDEKDAHAVHVKKNLLVEGAKVNFLDVSKFPSDLKIAWQPDSREGYLKFSREECWDLKEIKSVYWRNFNSIDIPQLDGYQKRIALNDSMSTIRSIFKDCPARWVNSIEAVEFHKEKPLQLKRVRELGVKIPKTLITNDPMEVGEWSQLIEKVIFKPVFGGSHTKILTESDLEPKRLSLVLKLSPVTIQEYIAGTNIRTYVIDKSIYSAEIRSNAIDFRSDSNALLIPIDLPESIRKQSLEILSALKLKWTAIDWRLSPKGEYYFLEANPSPMFMYFEEQTGLPITKKLVKLLTG